MQNTLSNDELGELTRCFTEEDVARLLLDIIGLTRSQQPTWRNPLLFWHAVDRELRGGAVADGRRNLLAAAAELYPHNEIFASPGAARAEVRAAARRSVPNDDDPVTLTVLMVDAVGFSKQIALTQVDWRETIYAVTDRALAAAGIPADHMLRNEDRGDGYLALVDVGVSLDRIVADFARELGIALRAHNSLRNDDGRVRLRVAVNQGVVLFDAKGFTSEAVIATARLVEADQVKAALVDAPKADLAFVISDKVFGDTVAERFRGLDQANFERIEVRNSKYEGVGWLQVDGRAPVPVPVPVPAPAPAPAPAADAVESAVTTSTAAATAATSSAAASGTAEAENATPEWDFFVSYAEHDKLWAKWVVEVLEAAKFSVHASYKYDVPGAKKHIVVQNGMRSAERTIAVLTPAYLKSRVVSAEWSYAWADDPQGVERKLVPVRVEECHPDGFLRDITWIDLVDKDEVAAARYLVEEVRASLAGRRTPPAGSPVFPGKPTGR